MVSPKRQASQAQHCETCNRSFKAEPALLQHCLAVRHQLGRCCERCSRVFSSAAGCEAHKNAKHGNPTGNRSGGMSQQGNRPAQLNGALAAACHTLSLLEREGYRTAEDSQNWRYRHHKLGPKPNKQVEKRFAVVIDCEMAGVKGRRNELIKLVVIDFESGSILIDSLVKPGCQITHWRSDCHGITPTIMSAAVAKKRVMQGWRAARAELWRHIDQNTIVIGQSVNNDLDVLRTIHTRIIDTALVTAEEVFGLGQKFQRKWSLQVLCFELLHVTIRSGNGIHDCLEDARASRNVTIWCLQNSNQLREWATTKYEQHMAEVARKKAKRQRDQMNKATQQQVLEQVLELRRFTISDPWQSETFQHHRMDDTWNEEDESLRWEDVIDYELWPKSPPESD